MCDGQIQQVADPHTLYAEPANLFVASLRLNEVRTLWGQAWAGP